MNRKFFSWIPTTSGRLSFSLASSEARSNSIFHRSNLSSGGRFFVAIKERRGSDFTFPFLSSSNTSRATMERLIQGNWAHSYYICYFKLSRDYEVLRGRAVLVSPVQWPSIRHRVLEVCESIPAALDDSFELDGFFRDFHKVGISSIRFSVRRNGSVFLHADFMDEKSVEVLLREGEAPGEFLCSHAYYLIREVFHTHRYHSSDSDTIINVYRAGWRKKINFSLGRKIVALRKNGDAESLEKARGILTYLEAFRSHVMKPHEVKQHKFSTRILREGIELDHEIAVRSTGRDLVSVARAMLRNVAGASLAAVAYLKMNYDVNKIVFSSEIDLFNLKNVNVIRDTTKRKEDFVEIYIRYTDDLIVLAVILFVSWGLLGIRSRFFASAMRDMIRLAIARPGLVRFLSVFGFVSCVVVLIFATARSV